MLNFTDIMRIYFRSGAVCGTVPGGETENVQNRILFRLLKEASRTEYGKRYGFAEISSYGEFASKVPVVQYPDLRPYIMRMVEGEKDILWKGRITRFAQSSGTSDGKSKFIPITPAGLRRNHYRGASTAVARYLANNPDSRIFSGKGFILGGSFANTLGLKGRVKAGDLSAHLIDRIPEFINFFRTPSKKTALMEDWNAKLPELVSESINEDVTNISGVPSWFLTVLNRVLEATGKKSVFDVWRNLEVFFHGGISFTPYRDEYNKILDPSRMKYVETYNASEGFFAVQDLPESGNGMELLLDCGVFYEFIPLGEIDSKFPAALTVRETVPGEIYALCITSPNGLWRYMIGDTVRIENKDPLRITIAGRTHAFINAFGEEVMVYNADRAIAAAAVRTGAAVRDYTAAPIYAEDGKKGRHQWIVEFSMPPADIKKFAAELDSALMQENSDYQAKRTGGLFLDPPEVIAAPPGTFDALLAQTGKLGGQRKVPRLSNGRQTADRLIEIIGKKK